MESSLIRSTFLDFFKKKGHEIVDSAPMVMKDDPTLMFTNAGMNQFKDFFLGNRKSKFLRIADTQKCLRVSGKHNDLEEVGVDTYHHTMFEMLGNWSFGDYFKEEAIQWAYELLVEEYKIEKDRLYATYFSGNENDSLGNDDETKNIWEKYFDKDKILGFGKEDNFWEMGETGPCGPCSEIHIDLRSDADRKKVNAVDLVNQSHPEVIELWNLVFIQYNRNKDKSLDNLPNKHVDTGLGLERLARVLQAKNSNYDSDIFMVLIHGLERKLDGIKYGFSDDQKDVAFRVIVDHLRAVSFAIAEGKLPSNTGAGYVIRRILRRAIRYAYSFLGVREAVICDLVPFVVQNLGYVFAELHTQSELIQNVIREEEESFLRTLSKGIERFEKYVKSSGKLEEVDGKFAFELYDTYGFPLDLTELLAQEKSIAKGVNKKDFDLCLEEQKNRSRKAGKFDADDWQILLNDDIEEFVGYDKMEVDVYISRYRKVIQKNKELYHLVFNITPFYAESGGQVGDVGYIVSENERISILDTKKENNVIIHVTDQIPVRPEEQFTAHVDMSKRQDTERNHSATHLLHHSLREVLGNHVEQKGSLVHPDYLRFDFSHYERVSENDLRKIEKIINEQIKRNIALDEYREIPLREAKGMKAIALFGEKYGDLVRVVKFGNSVELCGGTHVRNTAQIGHLIITSEGSISAGIRRIEAISGNAADAFVSNKLQELSEVSDLLKNPKDVKLAITKLLQESQSMKKELEVLRKDNAMGTGKELEEKIEEINATRILLSEVELGPDEMKNLIFQLVKKYTNLMVALATIQEDKVVVSIGLGSELVKAAKFTAKGLINEISQDIEGGGGGQDHFATAGGKRKEGIGEALKKLREIIIEASR